MKISGLMKQYFEFLDSRDNHASRIFESMPNFLPIEPRTNKWELDKEDHLLRIFEFSDREKLKDFVQSALDLEDEMSVSSDIKLSKNTVQIQVLEDVGDIISERSRKFAKILDGFYNSLVGKD